MKTSFNFGEYRNNLSEEIKNLRKDRQKDKAKEVLEKSKADARYLVSSELHKLEKEVGNNPQVNVENIESMESLPPNWERIDISEKIPEWIKLIIDEWRIFRLNRIKDENFDSKKFDKALTKIIKSFFMDEFMEACKEELEDIKKEYERRNEKSDEYYELLNVLDKGNYTDFFNKKGLGDLFEEEMADWVKKCKVSEFLNEITEGKYPLMEARGHTKAYIHVIGGYNSEHSKGYLEDHTVGLSRRFDLNSAIKGGSKSAPGTKAHDGEVWVDTAANRWGNVFIKPVVLFTSENKAFCLTQGISVGSSLIDRGDICVSLKLPKVELEKAMKDGIITSETPIWADFADEVIDLSRGEILKHKYK